LALFFSRWFFFISFLPAWVIFLLALDSGYGVLETYTRTDQYLKELWTWLQEQPEYRGRTSLIVTTDHGRGRTATDWRNHGRNVNGASETWMAFVSPKMPQRGEWRTHTPLIASQVAATLIRWMGLDWKQFDSAIAPPVQ
jgi:hypothetical protein